MKIRHLTVSLSVWICIALLAATAPVEPRAGQPVRTEAYPLRSGVHENASGSKYAIAFREVVQVRGAAWVRLRFGDYRLGESSFVQIVSLEDGARQHLDSVSMVHYRGSSAYFNGDAVELELHVAPGESGIFVNVNEVTLGDPRGGSLGITSLCDGNDSRVSSSDPAVGRVVYMPAGVDTTASGTAWIGSNGAMLTAGHVVPVMDIVQFNVPSSTCDGTIRHPDPEHQYAADVSSAVWANDGPGENCPGPDCGGDWAVFSCFPNSETGLTPALAQGGHFYRMSIDDTATTVVVTGFGRDFTPIGCDTLNVLNEDSHTQQTDFGPFVAEYIEAANDVVLEYEVDTETGNSGSPIIPVGLVRAIGIHTDGGCDRPNTGNFGTGFENDDLEAALLTWHGPHVMHVDAYQWTTGDGTIFRPFAHIADAFKDLPSGGVICIVRGAYGETFSISRPMTLIAPVGTVIIGQ
jgi:hypothetical protein